MLKRVFYEEKETDISKEQRAHENLDKACLAAYCNNLSEFLRGLTLDEIMDMYVMMGYDDIIGSRLKVYECIKEEVYYRSILNDEIDSPYTDKIIGLPDLDRAQYYGYLGLLLPLIEVEKLPSIVSLAYFDDLIGDRLAILNSVNTIVNKNSQDKQYRLKK